MLDHIMSV